MTSDAFQKALAAGISALNRGEAAREAFRLKMRGAYDFAALMQGAWPRVADIPVGWDERDARGV